MTNREQTISDIATATAAIARISPAKEWEMRYLISEAECLLADSDRSPVSGCLAQSRPRLSPLPAPTAPSESTALPG